MSSNEAGDHRLKRASNKISEQHRELTLLEDRVREAITDRDEVATESALVKLEGALEAHFELEERAYYPVADRFDDATQERFRRLRDDHQTLRDDLGDLRDELKQSGLRAFLRAFTTFGHDLADHEQREEALMKELRHAD